MKIEDWPIDRIQPYQKNPRHNEAAVDAVAKSILEFGFRQPIVVDQTGVIVIGHARWLAAGQLGLQTVPVHVAETLSAAQTQALRIADNKLHELSEWNLELLSDELAQLETLGVDLDVLGFSKDELAELFGETTSEGLIDPDLIPAPPDEADTKPGDLWILGDHRLLCGDAGTAAHVDRLLDGAPVDLVNTDPPYNVRVEPRSNNAVAATGGKRATHQKLRARDRPLENDYVSAEEFERLLLAWFSQVARVLQPGRAFYPDFPSWRRKSLARKDRASKVFTTFQLILISTAIPDRVGAAGFVGGRSAW